LRCFVVAGNLIWSFFNRKKLVSTKGIEDLSDKRRYRSWFIVDTDNVSGALLEKDITRLKNWNWNCSWEKVLCAIGDLISVVLWSLVGLKAKDGFFSELLVFCIYHNQVINKYDCLANIFLCFLEMLWPKSVFSKRILLILCGVISEVKWNV
jgi:hypothetical protein